MHKMLLNLPDQVDTERLVVRPYRAGDGPAFHRLCLANRSHLRPYEEGNPALGVDTVEDAEVLVRTFAAEWAARSTFFLGAWNREDRELVGQVYIGVVGWTPPEFELGYFVDVDHCGRGFATEATRAAVKFAFDHLGAERLRLACDETNIASWRVAERCGFAREGHLRGTQRHVRLPDGRWSGDYLYGLLREEFERRYGPGRDG